MPTQEDMTKPEAERTKPATPPQSWDDAVKGHWIYRLTCWLFRAFAKIWLRGEIIGLDNIPKSGPVMVLSTHCSFLDPPMVGSHILREAHYLSREGILKVPVIGYISQNKLNAHPIRRGASDREALRTCRNILKSGSCLVFYPEGTRSRTGKLGPIQGGFAMILEGLDVPYIPAVAQSTYGILPRGAIFPRPRKLTVIYGEPKRLPERAEGEPSRDYFKRCAEKLERELRELGAQ